MTLRITSLWLPALGRYREFSFVKYCLLVGCLLALKLNAQAQTWQKAVVSAGARGEYRVAATAADALGNVYLAGSFSGTVQFGSTVLASPTNSFGTNAFVAKWSSAANAFAWAQQVQGTGSDYATAVAVQGNAVYVAGNFDSASAGFGSLSLANAGSFSSDVFVAKLLDAGSGASFVWAQRAGGAGSDAATGLVVNGASVYVAGSFISQAGFGATVLTSAGDTDAFVAKLTDAGFAASFTWAQAAGSTSADAANGLAAQGTSLYLTGYFRGPTASFGAATVANASTPSTYDVFVAKLVDAGSSGSFVWAQPAGGTARDIGYAIAVSGPSVYVTGVFEPPTAKFGSLTLTASSAPNTDAFVAKLTDAGATGSFVWVQQVGGPGYEQPVALGSAGPAVYLAGYFGGPTATFGSTTLTTRGSNDIFVARLTDAGPAGSYSWVQQAGGTGNDYASSLVVAGAGVYVGGSLTLPASFGSQQLSGPSITASSFTGYWALLTDDYQPLAAAMPTTTMAGPFPNPAHAAVSVRLPAPVGAAQVTLGLTNALGQVVRQLPTALPAASTTVEVPLLGLVPGVYQLWVLAGSQRTSYTVVVE